MTASVQTSDEDGHHEGGHGSFKSYMIGFVLSGILTVIPFNIVMGDVLGNVIWSVFIVFALGASQMIVHIYYFLHATSQAEEGWLAMSISFTVLLVVIVMTGSIWVMFNLQENLMPGHEQIERVRSLP
jgi:cytochrome o ubiquinol oxidase operon protein cyoD